MSRLFKALIMLLRWVFRVTVFSIGWLALCIALSISIWVYGIPEPVTRLWWAMWPAWKWIFLTWFIYAIVKKVQEERAG